MKIEDILHENSDDLISFFKKYNIKYRKYSLEKCYVLKINSDNIIEEWQRYLRGLIYNYEEKRILVLPPVKAYEVANYMDEDFQFTELFDGTMINVFYNNDKWKLSSRSTIGCNNRWLMNKTYKELFEETQNINYESLNKDYSYSFVLRNKNNRNISFIEENEIILVKIYDTNNNCDVELDDSLGFKIPKVYNTMNDIDITDCRIKGVTYMKDNKRYKWLTMSYKYMKELKLNINDKSIMYFELKKNGNLKEYLKYFPEDTESFSNTGNFLLNLRNILYDTYFDVYVKKNKEFKDINYEYKPLIKDIHSIYLSSGEKIRIKTIENYLHKTSSKRLKFIMNYSK